VRKPGCAQGTALETPCPDDDVIATCTLETTGVVHKTYKGAKVALAEKGCKTLGGTFAAKK
jgi:hypothetical protein